MKRTRKKDIENLSAYLDDEAPLAPEDIDSILESDEELAARHAQWSKLSQAMRAMSDSEVHPAFHTRTMAAIREIEPAPKPVPWRWPAMGGALVAACTLAIVYFYGMNETTAPVDDTPAFADATLVESTLTAKLEGSADYVSELALEYGVDMWEMDDTLPIEDTPSDIPPEDSEGGLEMILATLESSVTDHMALGPIVDTVDAGTEMELKSLMLAYADEELYL